MTQEELNIANFKNVYGPRKHKVNGSYGVYDAYKWIRKNKWLNIGRPLTEHLFYTIIRTIHKEFAKELLNNRDIILPLNMGKLELRKRLKRLDIIDGKLVTNLPIDWDRTLKLWNEDPQSRKDKILIRQESKEIFKVHYNKTDANYNNQVFYEFNVTRDIKKRLKQRIKDNKLDAFIL